jgi:hypothetical protein
MANLIYQRNGAILNAPNAVKTAFAEMICSWTLRLILPMVLGAGGLLFYWICIDGQNTMVAWQIAGMIPLAVSFIAVAIWAFKEWLPPPENH